VYAGGSGGAGWQRQSAAEPDIFGDSPVAWFIVDLVLALACLSVLFIWLYRLSTGQVNPDHVQTLFYLVALYILCIAGGWLWGRFVRSPEEEQRQKEFEVLRWQVEQLSQNKQQLTMALNRAEGIINQTPGGNSALRISRVTPAPSIYERELDPEDTSDMGVMPHLKVFPVKGEKNALDFGWKIIGVSRRGWDHVYHGKYREDDFAINILGQNDLAHGPGLIVAAIADGVGSKKLSRRGARAAVLGATNLNEGQIAPLRLLLKQKADLDDIGAEAGGVLMEALSSAHDAVLREAESSLVEAGQLASTLLVFVAAVVGPAQVYIASVQIGDGALFAVRSGQVAEAGARWKMLQAPQIQGAGNEVHPFLESSSTEWDKHIRSLLLDEVQGIMGVTDGVADDIEAPHKNGNGPEDQFALVNDFHQRIITPAVESSQPGQTLIDLLGYKKKQSIDDRTLVYLYRE
jgi:hypothetical protein